MLLRFDLPFQLPALNDMLDSKSRQSRRTVTGYTWNAYNDMKQRYAGDIRAMVRLACGTKIPKIHPHSVASIEFRWREPDERRDPDNIAAGGTKLILDSLQAMNVIHTDGWSLYANHDRNHRAIFKHFFSVEPKHIGVEVTVDYQL
jgi:hypothetical protein